MTTSEQTTRTTTEHEYRRLSAPVDLAAERAKLSPERRNAADAMRLYMSLSTRLHEAIADRDRNAYRRALRARNNAASRLERRYAAVSPSPRLPLGNLRTAPKMPRPQQQQQPAPQLRDAA